MLGQLLRGLFKLVDRLTRELSKARTEIVELKKDSKAWYKVSAVRDSKTCNVCKMMDGRKVELPTRNGYVNYGDLQKKSGWGKENLIPPYHPNCRCTLVPTFGT